MYYSVTPINPTQTTFERHPNRQKISLQCRRILGGRSLLIGSLRWSRHLWFYDRGRLGRVEIVTLTVGVRAKKEEGGGWGEKKIRLPDNIVLLRNAVRYSGRYSGRHVILCERERLSWFALCRRGTFDRGWLRCRRIDTDGFGFSPCWTGFVRRVESTFAALNWGTFRGCYCGSN